MFERFSQKSRQAVFFARFEASQLGSPYIESEHLLLGIFRKDADLTSHLLGAHKQLEALRKRIEAERPVREKVSTSIDLPLSHECRRILAQAIHEAGMLHQEQIEAIHLLLGILHEEQSFAAKLLRESGITPERVRQEAQGPPEPVPAGATEQVFRIPHIEGARNLTLAAIRGGLDPLIGRAREMELLESILCRRTRHCAALIGEAGAGKSAIVAGLAQRIADGICAEELQDRAILSIDVVNLAWKRGRMVERLEETLAETTILSVEDLFESPDADHIVMPLLLRGAAVIGGGTPVGFRRAVETAPVLAGYFHVIEVLPPSEEEAETILAGLKSSYERFHEVTIAVGAIHAAVVAARRFPTRRALPDRAIDVLDEACARARVRKVNTVTSEDIQAVLASRAGSKPQESA